MSRKKKSEKLKRSPSLAEIGTEARHRSRIFFSRHKTVGQVIESRKYKATKHRQREELSWNDE